MSVIEKLRLIQSELKAPKSQWNSFGKYKYRSLEDIEEALKPLLLKHEVTMFIRDQINEVAGIPFVEACAILSDGEKNIEVRASAGIDINKKGMDYAQSFGASSSYARKYALAGMFLIDDTADSDATNTHGKKEEKKPEKPIIKVGCGAWEKAIEQGASLDKMKEHFTFDKATEEQYLKEITDKHA